MSNFTASTSNYSVPGSQIICISKSLPLGVAMVTNSGTNNVLTSTMGSGGIQTDMTMTGYMRAWQLPNKYSVSLTVQKNTAIFASMARLLNKYNLQPWTMDTQSEIYVSNPNTVEVDHYFNGVFTKLDGFGMSLAQNVSERQIMADFPLLDQVDFSAIKAIAELVLSQQLNVTTTKYNNVTRKVEKHIDEIKFLNRIENREMEFLKIQANLNMIKEQAEKVKSEKEKKKKATKVQIQGSSIIKTQEAK